MDHYETIAIVGGTFAYAIIRGMVVAYLEYRRRRKALPAHVRNSGLLTDTRLRIFEGTVIALFTAHLVWLLGFIAWFVGGSHGLWDFEYPLI